MNEEERRLEEARAGGKPWKKWGPYLSERQWGTVREDYSESGDAWNYFTHDQARSRAYRWGEDGIAGLSDDKQRLCFCLCLWNGQDPILKERLFGLTNAEGNHGEDVKEYYFYLDSSPTHSYMKYLYKYPQAAYPYDDIVKTNHGRTRTDFEYELIDTGVFAENRYFDVFVEYAKAAPEDILVKITAYNRGPEAAPLHILPTLWFRNTWSRGGSSLRPTLAALSQAAGDGKAHAARTVVATHPELGRRYLAIEADVPLLFTENETNTERLFGTPNRTPYVKDGIDQAVVQDQAEAINPGLIGTKMAAHHTFTVEAGETATVRLRLTNALPAGFAVPEGDTSAPVSEEVQESSPSFGPEFDAILETRRWETDEFYSNITPPSTGEDAANVMRQALAGMLWSKQYYSLEVDLWLEEHGVGRFDALPRAGLRNREWFHMINDEIVSMPDKWEYPWYAAWDLAFHSVVLAMVDVDFAKEQLQLLLREVYLHPSGQLPAYEWNFGDVNPPVHAWATLFVYETEKEVRGTGDIDFLKRAYQKLLLNFTWWVNRKDVAGRNVFQGGFLGLDNIGIFDRSAALPSGGFLEQADGTAWMAFYCQTMLQIALELSTYDPAYEEMIVKFTEHFLLIASAMDRVGENQDEMWDEEDGFYYDLLHLPDGTAQRIKVRSLVGLIPLCASTVISAEQVVALPALSERVQVFIQRHQDALQTLHPVGKVGMGGRHLLAVLNEEKLRHVLARMLDEERFLSPHGIRSLSRYHLEHPFEFEVHGEHYRVTYLPAESDTGMFGGNSNWRGPVWAPINMLIVRALLQLYLFYGDEFTVECPTGSGRQMNLFEVAQEISRRFLAIFLRGEDGRRPVHGGTEKFQTDPHWRDLLLFYEYFHGDNGAGLGASHQTGWTGIVARGVQVVHFLTAKAALANTVAPTGAVYRPGREDGTE